MRIMRLMVMFDLPTGSKAERRSYALFRKFLIEDGYYMDQYSVYSRVVATREAAQIHINRIKENLPSAGLITVFEMTEKQYEDRLRLLGAQKETPRVDQGAQLTLVL